MKKIAVIIPSYNSFRYSERCLKALEQQTFRDFCVCVVDDCSTDDSYDRLCEYAEKSPLDMTVLRSDTNRGPGHARKIGLEHTASEWVAFCDMDDWYDDDFLEVQLRHAEDSGSDLVMCDHFYDYGSGEAVKSGATDWVDHVEATTETVLAYAKMSLWRLLARRSLFEGVEFPEIYYGEDAPVTIQLIANAGKTFVDRDAHYHYFIRNGSASFNSNPRSVGDYLAAYEVIKRAIGDEYPRECAYIGINMVLYGVTLLMLKNRSPKKDIKRAVQDFEKVFPDWNANPYLVNLDKKKQLYLLSVRRKCLSLCGCYAWLHSWLLNRQARQ